ncbi:MAG: PH domain-containing protein [bacterium]
MGLFSGTKTKNPKKYVEKIKLDSEQVACTYKLHRNFISLTSWRVIIVKKSLFSREVSIRSIPYEQIDNIIIEKNRRLFSMSSLIKIINNRRVYKFRIGKGEGDMDLYNTLVYHICNSDSNNPEKN